MDYETIVCGLGDNGMLYLNVIIKVNCYFYLSFYSCNVNACLYCKKIKLYHLYSNNSLMGRCIAYNVCSASWFYLVTSCMDLRYDNFTLLKPYLQGNSCVWMVTIENISVFFSIASWLFSTNEIWYINDNEKYEVHYSWAKHIGFLL